MRIMRWLGDNLTSLVISLFLAIVVWIVAIQEENPLEEAPFTEPIPVEVINLPAGTTLFPALQQDV